MPLLGSLTDCNLTVASSLAGPFKLVHFNNFPGTYRPRVKEFKLARLFRTRIKRLVLSSRPLCIPDPFCFDNLQEIYVDNKRGIYVQHPKLWEDDAKLLRICRATVNEPPPARDKYAAILYPRRSELSYGTLGWVLQMVTTLQARESFSQVRVIVSHAVIDGSSMPQRLAGVIIGNVLHDVTAGTITRKPYGGSSDISTN